MVPRLGMVSSHIEFSLSVAGSHGGWKVQLQGEAVGIQILILPSEAECPQSNACVSCCLSFLLCRMGYYRAFITGKTRNMQMDNSQVMLTTVLPHGLWGQPQPLAQRVQIWT